jgi:hypothetical protein
MQKVFAMIKGGIAGMIYFAVLFLLPAVALADDSEVKGWTSHINGESLMYFILLLFIGYLFFRKPLP